MTNSMQINEDQDDYIPVRGSSDVEKRIFQKISDRIREEFYDKREIKYHLKDEEKEVLEVLQSLLLCLLRLLLILLVLLSYSSCRRVQVSYCRQLWDDNYRAFHEFDKIEEQALQQVFIEDYLILISLYLSPSSLCPSLSLSLSHTRTLSVVSLPTTSITS